MTDTSETTSMPPAEYAPGAPHLLVVAPDVVGRRMAGPGLRSVKIAEALAPFMPVTLAVGVAGSESVAFIDPRVVVARYDTPEQLRGLVDAADVLFCQLIDDGVWRHAVATGTRVVFDYYNALPVETIGSEVISGHTDRAGKDVEYGKLIAYFTATSRGGSYFVASNERQRDWWLGFIMAARGVLPSTLGGRSVSQLIGLAPFGMDASEPHQNAHGLRGRHGIGDDDIVLVWAGGIWDWLDTETPIRAVAAVAADDPRVKLVFYGTTHPNAAIGRPPAVERSERLAESLGVLGTQVIFFDDWVPADERADYLLDADAAVFANKANLESFYAFRTRVLDHFWAKLPSLVTDGDWFADYIEREGLGLVTPSGDVTAMADAIRHLVADGEAGREMVRRIESVRDRWRWSETTRELREFLLGPISQLPLPVEPSHDDGPSSADPPRQIASAVRRRMAAVPGARRAARMLRRAAGR